MNISYSIPAYLSDFSSTEDARTIAKLKMFYVGETGDGRVFDKDFAEELVKSLPCTPVVAFYSDLKDDFIGHNSTQYIYGFVKPDANHGFEKDADGTEWFITEVMLYTDRIDNIGEVAKKIVGHAQSLEMDPDSVEFELKYANGKRKIHFTKARLAGLSVLGKDQKPAFTGSEFFVDNADLRERFENFFSCLEHKDRGVSMNQKEQFAQLLNFMRLSYGEKENRIQDYAQQQLGDDVYVYVAEMFDDQCVLAVFDFNTGNWSYTRYDYKIDEQGVALENGVTCYRRFVSMAEIELLDNSTANASTAMSNATEAAATEGQATEATEATSVATSATEAADPAPETPEAPAATEVTNATESEPEAPAAEPEGTENVTPPAENAAPVTCTEATENADPAPAEPEAEVTNLTNNEGNEGGAGVETPTAQTETQENSFTSNSSSLSDSEREELERFRHERKVSLIDSYKGELETETIQSFLNKVNEMSYEDLEAQLAIAFRKFSQTHKQTREVPFSFANLAETSTAPASTSYKDLVAAQLRKK